MLKTSNRLINVRISTIARSLLRPEWLQQLGARAGAGGWEAGGAFHCAGAALAANSGDVVELIQIRDRAHPLVSGSHDLAG